MRIRLVALIPAAVLVGIIGGGLGAFVGWEIHGKLMGGHGGPTMAGTAPGTAPATNTAAGTGAASDDVVIYQCGMHNPPYEQSGPGNCPICGMVLQAVHVHRGSGSSGVGVRIDPVMVQNMGVRTVMPVVGKLTETVRAVGSLVEPEEKKFEVNLRVNGWIEKLYANKEGMAVTAGMPLFELYSPEVTAAADELITAKKGLAELAKGTNGNGANKDDYLAKGTQAVLDAGRRKLLLLGLTKEQVDAIEKMDKAPATVTITSPINGHISEKRVVEGGAVKAMDRLMEISDRSAMWLIVEVFEGQLGVVKVGQKVEARVDALPGKVFQGQVDFIYPHLEAATRTARIRVVLPNAEHELRQGMFAEAKIAETAAEEGVLVPREAVLDTGRRQVVFVALGGGRFEGRDVKVGRAGVVAGGDDRRYVAVTGIGEKDAVVTSGQFLLDSESRLEEARRKFLMPAGMPGMDMSGGGGK